MPKAGGILALLTLALALPAHADARTFKWRVTGSITGTYSNSVSSYSCEETKDVATFSEVAHAHLKMLPRAIAKYRPGRPFVVAFRFADAGDWRITGSFPERHVDDLTSQSSCSPPEAIDCRGALVLDRTRSAADGTLGLNPAGRRLRGGFGAFRTFGESAVVQEIAGPKVCNPYREDPNQFARPLFGLASGELTSDAVIGVVSITERRLRGRRAFAYTAPPAKPDPDECVGDQWLTCSQAGGLVLELRFRPA